MFLALNKSGFFPLQMTEIQFQLILAKEREELAPKLKIWGQAWMATSRCQVLSVSLSLALTLSLIGFSPLVGFSLSRCSPSPRAAPDLHCPGAPAPHEKATPSSQTPFCAHCSASVQGRIPKPNGVTRKMAYPDLDWPVLDHVPM